MEAAAEQERGVRSEKRRRKEEEEEEERALPQRAHTLRLPPSRVERKTGTRRVDTAD